MRRAQAVNGFLGGAPRYVIEATGMVLIVALALMLSQRNEGLEAAIGGGIALAAAGAFVLGPIGVAAGLLGLVIQFFSKKNKCIEKASGGIAEFCDRNSREI